MHRWTPVRRISIRPTMDMRFGLLCLLSAIALGLAFWVHTALADSALQLCTNPSGSVFYASAGGCPNHASTALPPLASQADLAALQTKLAGDEAAIATLQSK